MKSLLLSCILFSIAAHADLNIYTDRSVDVVQPMAAKYTEETGVKVNIISEKYNDIVKRLEVEGGRSVVDLIFVKDLVYLNDLTDREMLQPMDAEQSLSLIETSMKHPDSLWTAVTIRPRTIVYNKITVDPSEVSNYSDLANPKWKGRVCLRTSNSSYNVALASSFINDMGYEAAKEMMQGWKDNLAKDPERKDSWVLDAISEGTCDVGIVNSYYLARKLKENPEFPVGIVFANQGSTGAYLNGTGIGVAVGSDKVSEASAFIDLLLSEEGQHHFSNDHLDYPARQDLQPQTLVKEWGTFEFSEVNWSVLGLQRRNTQRLFEEIGYL